MLQLSEASEKEVRFSSETGRATNLFADLLNLSVPRAPACVWCYRMNGMDFFSFAALNLPTCDWLGCSRALKPRRSASSAALVEEPGSDSQKLLNVLWSLGL